MGRSITISSMRVTPAGEAGQDAKLAVTVLGLVRIYFHQLS
jgi:hypothetical protein